MSELSSGQILLKKCLSTIKEEHKDWVDTIKKAEDDGTGVDLNLAGRHVERLNSLIDAFIEHDKSNKKGLFR